MAFCTNCGEPVESGKFCPKCGTPVGESNAAAPVGQASDQPPVGPGEVLACMDAVLFQLAAAASGHPSDLIHWAFAEQLA